MPKYYIHAEAFNLDHMVYDTHDISTIRGGSFILLDAVKNLPKAIGRLEPIATAASKGVFAYEDPGDLPAQRTGMAQRVFRTLHDATDGQATFLVAVAEDIPNDFPLVLDRLEAEVRRQQWRMPTIVVPDFDPTDQECYLDGWRPGVERYAVEPGVAEAKISASTRYRRQRGRELKHTLFLELFEPESTEQDDVCANDLGQLATDPSKGILNGKIAFIHVDGNSFGRIRREKCNTSETRKAFDACIQKRREGFLADLRETAHEDSDFRVKTKNGKDVLRLEVLLWGGDEFDLVVPAWKGLEVLERFYRIADGLTFEGVPMTHRAVVIFCHYNAPILQIRRLAERLLDMSKNDIKRQFKAAFATDPTLASIDPKDRDQQLEWLSNAKYGNAARYLVLESFDMLRGSLEQFLERYYGRTDTSDLLLYGQKTSELRSNLHIICRAAPKGRVVEIAQAISRGDEPRGNELRKRLPDSIAPDQRDAVLAAIDALMNDNNIGWYLLADLWDYAEEWKA